MVLRPFHAQHLHAFAVIPAYTRPLMQFRVSAHHAVLLRAFHSSFPSRAEDSKDAAPMSDVKSPTATDGNITAEGNATTEGDVMTAADIPEATAKATQETGPANPSRRRKKFLAWVKDQGAKYQKPAFGTTNYLNEGMPFPMNPFFRPNPPVADKIREAIYKSYTQNSETKTPRILATEYNLSIRRVEAILKLKALESRMVEGGFIPQKGFTKGMEQLLGTESQLRESLKEMVPQVGKPRFKMVQEEVEFSAEEAAASLGRTPHALIQEHAMQAETYRAFVLEDGGNQKRWEVPRLFIRDKDGTLRAAARSELMKH
ncbi:eukaryotic mitochondrial regulator protein-domain-containing protein [Endogone sp. FLAS-F59071]|nr:eukaryotic mitochondrial regulator protein-domain-containing protein [Endogone sp. FLAS-F59071]|eukprot:RUS17084.1 eukaryotic mitochondrial regulator protein-domain-containing protein [Endogone sp. FLAS-F59071]